MTEKIYVDSEQSWAPKAQSEVQRHPPKFSLSVIMMMMMMMIVIMMVIMMMIVIMMMMTMVTMMMLTAVGVCSISWSWKACRASLRHTFFCAIHCSSASASVSTYLTSDADLVTRWRHLYWFQIWSPHCLGLPYSHHQLLYWVGIFFSLSHIS